jgi:hypothetical protein
MGPRRCVELSPRHCEEQSDEAIQSLTHGSGLLRGACHRAALCADPLARNDGVETEPDNCTLALWVPAFADDKADDNQNKLPCPSSVVTGGGFRAGRFASFGASSAARNSSVIGRTSCASSLSAWFTRVDT